MALPPDATARDRWLDLANEARANREEARAAGDHEIAGLWDEQERTLLDNAYGDVPFSDADAGGTPGTGFDPGDSLAMGEDPAVIGDLLAANTRPKGSASDPKPLPPERQAENVRNAREAMSNPMVYAFMRALSAAEGDYDQLVGGKRFKGTKYPGEASGAYEITNQKHKELLAQLGPMDFSRDSQDVMAAHIIVSNRDRALDDILRGNLEDAVSKLRGTWPSLPGPDKQSHTDMATFTARFNAMVAQP